MNRGSVAISCLVLSACAIAGGQAPTAQGGKAFDQAQALTGLRERIAGQADRPAAEVFENIQLFKRVPAGKLLSIMEIGFARSLGVDCTHCHVPDEWDKDDKPAKQIARDMWAMVQTINTEQLKKIRNLESENPAVNCTTCHRGDKKPALNMP
jgi:hypothetical protein